jgi:undecaprenyl diphosphate synthase
MSAISSHFFDEVEQKEIFSSNDLAMFDREKGPSHIAIMMDGNRRWARNNQLKAMRGHLEGAEVLTRIVRAAIQLGVRTLTVYAFSTENWNRTPSEIDYLMKIFELYLIRKRQLMMKEGIRLDAIGDLSQLPPQVQNALQKTRLTTQNNQKINLVLALNYGSRDEIRRAIGRILERHDEKKIVPGELTEKFISQFLDTNQWGDPDLLIRTSGEMRVSNFLLWQISYTEFYVTDVLWPAFTPQELLRAVLAFQARQRRLGGG